MGNMAKVTPAEYAEKWARRTAAATADYTRGVARVTEAPGIAAAAKQDKMLAQLTESILNGTWARRVAGVSLQSWKDSATTKGAPRIAAGVQAAQADMQRFGTELLARIDSVKGTIDQMPDLTLEDRIQRSVAFQRAMAEFKRA